MRRLLVCRSRRLMPYSVIRYPLTSIDGFERWSRSVIAWIDVKLRRSCVACSCSLDSLRGGVRVGIRCFRVAEKIERVSTSSRVLTSISQQSFFHGDAHHVFATCRDSSAWAVMLPAIQKMRCWGLCTSRTGQSYSSLEAIAHASALYRWQTPAGVILLRMLTFVVAILLTEPTGRLQDETAHSESE